MKIKNKSSDHIDPSPQKNTNEYFINNINLNALVTSLTTVMKMECHKPCP